jgi:hypothetical protein
MSASLEVTILSGEGKCVGALRKLSVMGVGLGSRGLSVTGRSDVAVAGELRPACCSRRAGSARIGGGTGVVWWKQAGGRAPGKSAYGWVWWGPG